MLASREDMYRVLNRINKQMQFKDAHLELLSDNKLETFIEFLENHFFPDDILTNGVKMIVDNEVRSVIKRRLEGNLSLLLISDISNEVIASQGITIGNKKEAIDLTALKNKSLKKLLNFILPKQDELDIYTHYNVKVCVEFHFLATHKEHRKQGLASKMMQAGLLFSKHLGLDPICVKGGGTSMFSQRVFEKLGFETLCTRRYDEYKMDGEIVFQNTGDHKSAKVYIKQL